MPRGDTVWNKFLMAGVFFQELMTAHMTNITEHHPPSHITTPLSAGLCLATVPFTHGVHGDGQKSR